MKLFHLSVFLTRDDQEPGEEGRIMSARQDVTIDLDKMSGTPKQILTSALATIDLDGLFKAATSELDGTEFPLDGESEH